MTKSEHHAPPALPRISGTTCLWVMLVGILQVKGYKPHAWVKHKVSSGLCWHVSILNSFTALNQFNLLRSVTSDRVQWSCFGTVITWDKNTLGNACRLHTCEDAGRNSEWCQRIQFQTSPVRTTLDNHPLCDQALPHPANWPSQGPSLKPLELVCLWRRTCNTSITKRVNHRDVTVFFPPKRSKKVLTPCKGKESNTFASPNWEKRSLEIC